MLAALIIVFREVIEAGLVVGIVLAVTRNVASSRLWTLGGVAGGVVASCLVAAFTGVLAAAFEGSGQELFNAAVLAIAVVMLVWHNVWMARHGRAIAAELKATGEAVTAGGKSLAALAVVVAVAVLREGSEVVLFLYGIAVSDGGSPAALFIGALGGFALGAAVSALTFYGLLRIPGRHLFAVTSTLIALLAAGLAAQCVSFLEQAGVLTLLSDTAWNTSALLSDKSILGRVLHTLVGYADQPSYLQIAAYAVTLAVIFALTRVLTLRTVRTMS